MKSFASDNYASVHPEILKTLEKVNRDHAKAYGADAWTEKLNEQIKEIFGSHASAFPVFNGTGANVIAISALAKSYEAVLCSDVSHIHVDECGACERHVGVKLIDIPCPDGKLSADKIRPHTLNYGNEHQVQAKVLSLTQSTERGTLYTLAELEALKKFSSEKGIKTFMDGARFANAVAALGVSPRKLVEAAGIQLLCLGGTKNGLMLGELVVVLNPALSDEMNFHRKQALHLASKMRYLSAQFCSYFENDLWINNAHHANSMARLLAEKIKEIPQLKISEAVEVNSLFVKVPQAIIEPLQKEYPFYVWDEALHELRWMCSFDTTEEDVNNFVKKIKELL